jgi:hypothetical protein
MNIRAVGEVKSVIEFHENDSIAKTLCRQATLRRRIVRHDQTKKFENFQRVFQSRERLERHGMRSSRHKTEFRFHKNVTICYKLKRQSLIMQPDRLQLQRFEIKYLVAESLALAARDFVRPYLTVDEFGGSKPNFSYPVHSLYLDSDDLVFFGQTFNGEKNRYKLRVRFYDENADSPVFLEIKKRTNNIISKQRCAIRRDALCAVIAGQVPDESLVLSKNPNQIFALHNFLKLMRLSGAKPKAHVAYLREAWISSQDNSVRMTMDRMVRFKVQQRAQLSTDLKRAIPVFDPEVILEIKFTNRFPIWFREFVRAFNLRPCSAAKYAEGINLYGEHRMKDELRLMIGHVMQNRTVTHPDREAA